MSWREQRVEHEWEELGEKLWCDLGKPEPPIDPLRICAILGLRIGRTRSDKGLGSHLNTAHRVVILDHTQPLPLQAFAVVHEAVHFMCPWLHDRDDDRQINYLVMSISMPRVHVKPMTSRTWALADLHRVLCPHFVAQVMARRVVSLEPEAGMSYWQDGKIAGVLRAPALRYNTPASIERQLADQLFEDRTSTRIDRPARVHAVAEDAGSTRYVVTIAPREILDALPGSGPVSDSVELPTT